MRALIIDDSKAMRFLLGHMLKGFGFEISEAGHGQDALEKLRQSGPFDIALVDWNMPVMNGYDFVRAVRAERVYDNLKLVMVTTECDARQILRALQAGADEYVMKPFTQEVITEKLVLMGFEIFNGGSVAG